VSAHARSFLITAVGVALLGASLRIAVATFSPIIDEVSVDIALPSWVIGLIGSAPPACFAVFGLLTPLFARRLSLEWLAVIALGVAASGIALRGLVGETVGLLATTLLIFAAVGVGNVIAPGLIKKHAPERVGAMTTVLVTAMSVATIVPAALAVPLAESVGWRVSLGMWAAVVVVAAVPWVIAAAGGRAVDAAVDVDQPRATVVARLLALPAAWAMVAGFAVSASTVYTLVAWLPTLLRERAGVDAVTAGAILAVVMGTGIPFGLVVPWVLTRIGAVRTLFVIAVVPGLAGIAGFVWAAPAAPWVWSLLLSLPTMLFPVMLTLIGLRTRLHATTVALSGMVQSLGYGIAAFSPLAVGALHDATDDWVAPLVLLAVVIAVGVPAGLVIARSTSVEAAWERRTGRAWSD
jgi:MFS transporter, CP family, cyanate transporter